MQRIVTVDLHLHAYYKVQLTDQKPANHAQHWKFANWILQRQQVDGDFSKKIIFDEATSIKRTLEFEGAKIHEWFTSNPCIHLEWLCGVDFFENDVGNVVTINGLVYRNILTNCWMEWMWMTLDFNKTVQSVTLLSQLLQLKFSGGSELNTKIVRFDTIRLFSVGFSEGETCMQIIHNSTSDRKFR